MALSEIKLVLINGLSLILEDSETITAIALMLQTDNQMLTMIDWIYKHQKENPSEDRVLRIAKLIEEQVS